ncbi:MAG: response regulator [Acidobacteriia bacterium]|nr:response regulator [Terriglobia bacterium]
MFEVKQQIPDEPVPQRIASGSETILLVDDANSLRAVTRELLEGCGYSVLEAENGERALQIADQCEAEISLLMTDLGLPKMSGVALAKFLLEKRPAIRVLYVSGDADEIMHSIVPDPGTAFLQKPFTQETLAQKVRDLLDSTQDTSPLREGFLGRGSDPAA